MILNGTSKCKLSKEIDEYQIKSTGDLKTIKSKTTVSSPNLHYQFLLNYLYFIWNKIIIYYIAMNVLKQKTYFLDEGVSMYDFIQILINPFKLSCINIETCIHLLLFSNMRFILYNLKHCIIRSYMYFRTT